MPRRIPPRRGLCVQRGMTPIGVGSPPDLPPRSPRSTSGFLAGLPCDACDLYRHTLPLATQPGEDLGGADDVVDIVTLVLQLDAVATRQDRRVPEDAHPDLRRVERLEIRRPVLQILEILRLARDVAVGV